jgi:hypothetical protein
VDLVETEEALQFGHGQLVADAGRFLDAVLRAQEQQP